MDDTDVVKFPESALNGSIIDRFDFIAQRFPTRLAISAATQSLTYSELGSLASRIAGAVTAAIRDRSGPVAIFRPNDALYPAAVLGILGAGRAYVPMDADYPTERNRLIASHAGVAAIITAGDLIDQARSLAPHGVPILDVAVMRAVPTLKSLRRPGPKDVAHILYTSGSTGTPKGVYQNHQGCLHAILQRTRALELRPDDRLVLFPSPSTVDGARITIAAILNGASLHILPPTSWNMPALATEIRARGITVCHSVPTVFRHLASALPAGERFNSVRIVHLSGERADWNDLHLVKHCCAPGALLIVALGSTESCASYVQWVVDEKIEQTSPQLPIGRDIPEFRLAIMDHDGRPVRDGEVGEIVVSSRHIALGYWENAELTASVFAVDAADPEVRIFKTGDLGRRRPDGLLDFLGRKDHQIKLHGNRIELGEIESTIERCDGVRDAVVLVRRSAGGVPCALVAYVTLWPGIRGLLPRHIQLMLARRLPRYMVPSQIIVFNELPRLPNFKIDRARLAQMDTARSVDMLHRLEDPLLDEVAGIFETVVGVSGVTADDTVASIGGDSLQAVTLVSEIERRYGVNIPSELIAELPTVRRTADWIRSQNLKLIGSTK